MTTFSHVGLYGKIPSQADFVRLRAAEGAARALVLWLEEGSEAAKRAGVSCGPEPVRFLFRPAGAAEAVVGVLVTSHDKVGRSFPLALFAQVEGPDLAPSFPALPRTAGGFLDAAAELARESAGLPVSELAARVERLPLPEAAEVARGEEEERSRAAVESGRDLLSRLFGEADGGQRLYGLHCFRTACHAARGKEPARAAAVLDCPVRSGSDRFVWLELARRGLGWRVPPSFFWLEGTEPRLLISLGPVPASVFGALWRPGASDARVWPLVTEKTAAVAAARQALGNAVIAALERHSLTVADLFKVVMP